MYRQIRKELALILVFVMALVWMPVTAKAAVEPEFQETFTTFYENRANKGIYNIQVNNVQKGYILKWHITGKGKKYASFDSAKTIAKANTAVNKLTIDSNGELAYAKGERIRITVNVYTSKWKLVKKLTFAGKLQSKAKAIDIDTKAVKDLKQLTAGETYEFQAVLTPANSTSKVYWQVKDSAGTDHSLEMADGKWTPVKSGDYTITAIARNSKNGQALCTKEVKASVGSYVETVSQSAANGVNVTFSSAIASQYKDADFTIKLGEASVLVKKVKYSEDGKTAYITTATNFIDGKKYTVTCAGHAKEFTASVGKPVQISITTATAQAGRYTTIEYALLDANGIDVTEAEKNGTFRYSGSVNNGLLDQQTNRLYMTTIGSAASITLDYISADGTVRLTDTKTITCVAQKADEAAETKFTLTKTKQTPSFKDADVREIAVGETLYAHFMALDATDTSITYDGISFASSDPDRLIISPDGRVTPIKPGAVTVVVTAMQGTYPVTYTFSITVKEARYMAAIQMKETVIAMSTVREEGYVKEIPVTVTDQYGTNFVLSNETGVITEVSGRTVIAEYDPDKNSVVINRGANKLPISAGSYNYVLTLTSAGRTLSQNFTIIASAPNQNALATYQVEASTDTLDLSVDENMKELSKTVKVRLAEYRGGVFNCYQPFEKVEIRKGNAWYTNELVNYSTAGAIQMSSGQKELTITPLQITPAVSNNGAAYCRKAATGTYTVTVTYVDRNYNYYGTTQMRTASTSIQITDGQKAPEYTIQRLMTSATMPNAYQMAVDCIHLQNGSIEDCVVTGYSQSGNAVTVVSGQQVHIAVIRVRSEVTMANNMRVSVTHDIPIDKTLTNK